MTDIEQYRAGFEAWAIGPDGPWTPRALKNRVGAGYGNPELQIQWDCWIAAKRDTSTSQGATVLLEHEIGGIMRKWQATSNSRYELCRAVEAEVIARCRAEGGNTNPFPCDHPYCECQKDGIDCKALSGNSGAAQGDALAEVHAFLMGEGPLDGVWFGEAPQGERSRYWWRDKLRAAISNRGDALDAAQDSERVCGIPGRQCMCQSCNPHFVVQMMFICPKCGDKRCPHAANHVLNCAAIAASTKKE